MEGLSWRENGAYPAHMGNIAFMRRFLLFLINAALSNVSSAPSCLGRRQHLIIHKQSLGEQPLPLLEAKPFALRYCHPELLFQLPLTPIWMQDQGVETCARGGEALRVQDTALLDGI